MGGAARPSVIPPKTIGGRGGSRPNPAYAAYLAKIESDKIAAQKAAVVSKQKLDALIASKYPQGLPSWVAANGLKPQLTTETNQLYNNINSLIISME